MMKKVQFTIQEELLEELDEFCRNNQYTRSGCICDSVRKAMNEQKVIDMAYNISVALTKAVESGSIDPELEREMKTFNALCQMFGR